jgi:hypothetical protein
VVRGQQVTQTTKNPVVIYRVLGGLGSLGKSIKATEYRALKRVFDFRPAHPDYPDHLLKSLGFWPGYPDQLARHPDHRSGCPY